MSIWVIQRIEALYVCNRRDLAYGYKSLFVDQFSNENNLATALQEGGITGVSQYNNDQDNDNNYGNSNIYEDPDNPPGIALDNTASCNKISGVALLENPVEIPGVAPQEKPVELPGVAPLETEEDSDVVPPLFPSDYEIVDESDE